MNTHIAETSPSALADGQKDYYSLSENRFLISPNELSMHIEGCALNNRESQKKIYTTFYEYGLTICDRYSNNHDDSLEILNDGFLKIFKEIHRYKPAYTDVVSSFKGWLRKIMIYTAIDHFRKNQKHRFTADLDNGIIQVSAGGEDALDKISYEEIIRSIQELTPGYRTVFNLFVIEGFTHEEISNQLGISIGASKSNLAKARKQLQKILYRLNHIEGNNNVKKGTGRNVNLLDRIIGTGELCLIP
ncbi:MAG TPA: sigma-70 family RNA polymerase sigma factor [Chitinophagaceae bacterium]|jgi:RNA polymerase sigma-70 factor (ECF subfamily)|nr:sigma-70 family RNA polymerase sigma factor [Chitinophagaceae bacterium]